MLKFGDVSFDLEFERGRMSATGYVAKISMLRLNIGSGKLSSCMLSIGLRPKVALKPCVHSKQDVFKEGPPTGGGGDPAASTNSTDAKGKLPRTPVPHALYNVPDVP